MMALRVDGDGVLVERGVGKLRECFLLGCVAIVSVERKDEGRGRAGIVTVGEVEEVGSQSAATAYRLVRAWSAWDSFLRRGWCAGSAGNVSEDLVIRQKCKSVESKQAYDANRKFVEIHSENWNRGR